VNLFQVLTICALFLPSPSFSMEGDNFEKDKKSISKPSTHYDDLEARVKDKKPIRILSLDGGGIRGIIELIWLIELQKETGQKIQDMFDIFFGTSTGGIIAAGLANGKTPEELLDIYPIKMKIGC
jgi:predicted acylesterase/phospholipase RssA